MYRLASLAVGCYDRITLLARREPGLSRERLIWPPTLCQLFLAIAIQMPGLMFSPRQNDRKYRKGGDDSTQDEGVCERHDYPRSNFASYLGRISQFGFDVHQIVQLRSEASCNTCDRPAL